MNLYLQLLCWTLALSFFITYAWWANFRVWILRQDLFEIRDRLWHQMFAEKMLDNPCHLETREAINAMIRMAPWLSLAMMFRILLAGAKINRREESFAPPAAVVAREQAVRRIMHYLLEQSAMGILLKFIVLLYQSKEILERQMSRWISRVFDSQEIRRIEPMLPAT